MDSSDVAKFLLVVSGGLFATTVGFAVAWVRARERLLRYRTEVVARPDTVSDRVDPAIDAIALEVERIGEQQRFLTKLLAENVSAVGARADSPATKELVRSPGTPPRFVTPH